MKQITKAEIATLLRYMNALWPSFMPEPNEFVVDTWLEQARAHEWTLEEAKKAITALQKEAREFAPNFSQINNQIDLSRMLKEPYIPPMEKALKQSEKPNEKPASDEVRQKEIAQCRAKYPHLFH